MPPNQSAQAQSDDEAAQLVRRALLAETKGQADQRLALLEQAEKLAPDFAPAHWQLADVQLDGKWAPFDAVAKDPLKTATLQEYRTRRDQADPKSYDDQMTLARWCEKAGLKDQQQLHLMMALRLQPRSAEARRKLNVVFHNGKWMQASQVEASDAQIKQQQQEALKWRDRLVKLRSQLEKTDTAPQALAELRQIDDEAVIPAMEVVFARSKPEVAKAVVEALSKMHYHSATESLMRFAVLSSDEAVRYTAAKALKSRSMYAYVPQLIFALDTPISVQFNKFRLPNGGLGYQLSLFKENPWGDKMYTSTGLMDPTWYASGLANIEARLMNAAPPARKNLPINVPVRPASAIADVTGAAAAAERRADQAMQTNTAITASNARIIDVLHTTTNQDFGDDAIAWFNWWFDYNEFALPDASPTDYGYDSTYSSPYRPTYSGDTADIGPGPTAYPIGMHSCFSGGTPVWTITGLMQIENIKAGEYVLAQNADTGELHYQPVLKATVGPLLPLINIRAGDVVLRCTLGHPFWVSGAGWKMAKELKAGDWLHSINGPVLVDSVEREKDPAVCYNLVVADFGTYFVGKSQILVHDINLRAPTDAIVPGLVQR